MLQVLMCMATITSIKHRTVLIRMLHNGGTLASCQRAAAKHDAAVLEGMQRNQAQAALAAERHDRLQSMEL